MSSIITNFMFCNPTRDEEAAKAFILQSDQKFYKLFNEMAEVAVDLEKAEGELNELLEGKLKNLTLNFANIIEEACEFPLDDIESETIKSAILATRVIINVDLLLDNALNLTQDSFYYFLENKNFCEFEKDDCELSFNNIKSRIKRSSNPAEILYYWKESRERNVDEAKKKLTKFFDIFKKYANKIKLSAKFAWFGNYLDENFDNNMENVMKDLEPIYKKLHAFIRFQLHKQYGNEVLDNGLIPFHFYEKFLIPLATTSLPDFEEFENIDIPEEFPTKKTTKEVIDIASSFMKSLGFKDLPAMFWLERLTVKKDNDEWCRSSVSSFGNITLLTYCNNTDQRRFRDMHADFAQIYYNNEYSTLPLIYADSYDIELAVGKSIALSSATPGYLFEVGLSNAPIFDQDEHIYRLFKTGVLAFFRIPEYFVHSQIILDILDDRIQLDDINEHYWNLMKKYLGVAPPIERTKESLDFPARFYDGIYYNVFTLAFVTEIMGYQIYKSLCERTGGYVKGNDALPLHNCNFFKNEEAGNILKEMMHLGTTKPWKEILGTVTGDNNGMKAGAILEYYEPLEKWLDMKNTEYNISVGW